VVGEKGKGIRESSPGRQSNDVKKLTHSGREAKVQEKSKSGKVNTESRKTIPQVQQKETNQGRRPENRPSISLKGGQSTAPEIKGDQKAIGGVQQLDRRGRKQLSNGHRGYKGQRRVGNGRTVCFKLARNGSQ